MGKQLIIYGSRYGSARRYAERLAEMTGLDAVEYNGVKDLDAYDSIVYLGSLYAGGVTGLFACHGVYKINTSLNQTLGQVSATLARGVWWGWSEADHIINIFLQRPLST